MSVRHTEMMNRVGMAGAIVPTYLERFPEPDEKIKIALFRVEFFVNKAIHVYGKVGKHNLEKIGNKIDLMREQTCLGKARSILTFIDYAVELLELSMTGDKPLASIGGKEGSKTIRDLVFSLLEFRTALTPKEHPLCLNAGRKAAEIWEKTI